MNLGERNREISINAIESAFWNSRTVERNDYIEWCKFIFNIAKKTCIATQSPFRKIMKENGIFADEKKKAVERLTWMIVQQ